MRFRAVIALLSETRFGGRRPRRVMLDMAGARLIG
jgi:hypothetical protein